MIKSIIKQAVAQLKLQPIISAVSIIGTALAIFLIMLVLMMQQVKTAPFAPESNRDRFLHALYLSVGNKESQYRIGNIFISDIRSFKDLRRNFQQYQSNEIRNHITGMAFLLINIFLGLLGTFWFRTQQRRCEIALHKAHGATNRMMFTRLLSEGWLLLLIITPIALAIDLNIANAELNAWRNGTTLEWDRLLFCGGISLALIALTIAIGISIPAFKAMQIDPAEALHDE